MSTFFHYTFFGVLLWITQTGSSATFIRENTTLTIDQGTLIGRKSLDYWNGTFYSFEGIPFAKPPVGELRFKAPQPAEKWSGIYNATKLRPMCPQIPLPSTSLADMEQNENCLFLNIHSKMSSKLKPVMVWFFGGGLEYGSVFDPRYGPELLLSEDIVMVKVSYRLNIFGFLTIDNPKYEILGNMGFKDQVLALKWVQKNIHHFGGDPNRVAIFGQSSGGTSVNLLCLSPLAKGLFHRAIIQSGVAEYISFNSTRKYIDVATPLNCTSNKLDEIVACINHSTTENLIKGLKELDDQLFYNEVFHILERHAFNALTIERNTTNSFLAETPGHIITKEGFHTVPTIIGFTRDEINENDAQNHDFPPNFTDYRVLIPPDIEIDLTSDKAFELGNRIKVVYYGNQTPSNELIEPLKNYLMDLNGLEKMYKYAKLLSKTTPVYFYEFNYYTKLNREENTRKKFINHGDDIGYLFYWKGVTPENLDKNSEEYIGIHRMIKLWTTFAKTGDPNPINDPLIPIKWLPIQSNKFNYLEISQNLELKQNPFEKRMKFWEEIYKEYNSN